MSIFFGAKEVPTKMYWKFLRITPEVAANWLEKNVEYNRPVSQLEVDKLSQQILNNEYLPTHEGMAILASGQLGDGQHTLWAVIQAGVPIDRWVCFEVPEKSYEKMNKGRKRGVSESLKMDRKYTDIGSAVLHSLGGPKYRTDDYVRDFVHVFQKPLDLFFSMAGNTKRRGLVAAHRAMAVLRLAIAMRDKKDVQQEYITSQYAALVARDYSSMSPIVLAFAKKTDEMLAAGMRTAMKDIFCRGWVLFDYDRRNISKIQIRDPESILNEIKYEIGKFWKDAPLAFEAEEAQDYKKAREKQAKFVGKSSKDFD